MKVGLLAAVLMIGMCSPPPALTATVDAVATTAAVVGAPVQLVLKVDNTGPLIPHLGLVFRSADLWFQRNRVTDPGGCSVSAEQSAFDCGDLQPSSSRTYTIAGVATVAGSFHFELALRELVQPFAYVNDHTDGPDVQTWDETVTGG